MQFSTMVVYIIGSSQRFTVLQSASHNQYCAHLRKQLTFHDTTNGFPIKWLLRNEYRYSLLMTCLCPVLQRIRSTTQIWKVTHHRYGISALVPQTSFGRETCGDVVKNQLFFQASTVLFLLVRGVEQAPPVVN